MGENIDKATGCAQQAAGDLAGDDGLKNEGKADEMSGKAKGAPSATSWARPREPSTPSRTWP